MALSNLPVDYTTLSREERREVREEYVRRQNGNCAHCMEPLSGPPHDRIDVLWVDETLFPETFFKWPVHLHHDHETGLTIGAVHCKCNAVLWQYHGE